MKIHSILFTLLFFLSIFAIQAQSSCKVLLSNLEGNYIGECRKGLAHGNGKAQGLDTYEGEFKKGKPHGFGVMYYQNGSKYIGEWKKGVKNGAGKFEKIFKDKDSVSIEEGFWKKGEYVGQGKQKRVRGYKVTEKEGVQRYNIRKVGDKMNRVTIVINNNGSSVRSPRNIIASGGTEFSSYGRTGFQNINYYPFTCQMRYSMPTKLGASYYPVEFSFEILQEGDWLVEVYH